MQILSFFSPKLKIEFHRFFSPKKFQLSLVGFDKSEAFFSSKGSFWIDGRRWLAEPLKPRCWGFLRNFPHPTPTSAQRGGKHGWQKYLVSVANQNLSEFQPGWVILVERMCFSEEEGRFLCWGKSYKRVIWGTRQVREFRLQAAEASSAVSCICLMPTPAQYNLS